MENHFEGKKRGVLRSKTALKSCLVSKNSSRTYESETQVKVNTFNKLRDNQVTDINKRSETVKEIDARHKHDREMSTIQTPRSTKQGAVYRHQRRFRMKGIPRKIRSSS